MPPPSPTTVGSGGQTTLWRPSVRSRHQFPGAAVRGKKARIRCKHHQTQSLASVACLFVRRWNVFFEEVKTKLAAIIEDGY